MKKIVLFSVVVLFLADVALASMAWQTSNHLRNQQRLARQLAEQITELEDERRLLTAQQAYLTTPDRLFNLARKHLPDLDLFPDEEPIVSPPAILDPLGLTHVRPSTAQQS